MARNDRLKETCCESQLHELIYQDQILTKASTYVRTYVCKQMLTILRSTPLLIGLSANEHAKNDEAKFYSSRLTQKKAKQTLQKYTISVSNRRQW
jgi:hypothetical protein